MPKKHKRNAKAVSLDTTVTASAVDRRTPAEHIVSQYSGLTADSPSSPSSPSIESCDYGDFDYDAVKADDGVELWLVRTPSAVRPSPFASLSLSLLSLSPHFRFFLLLIHPYPIPYSRR
jgi:hypothetical protein